MARDYYAARPDRLTIAHPLFLLGISVRWIATAIKANVTTISKDLKSIGLNPSEKKPDAKTVYANVFKRYAEIFRKEFFGDLATEDENLVWPHLTNYLGIDEQKLDSFLTGLEMTMNYLSVPGYPKAMEPCARLVKAVFGTTIKLKSFTNGSGRAFWEEYLQDVAKGEIDAPTSYEVLLEDVVRRFVSERRGNIHFTWPYYTPEVIDSVIRELREGEEKVIRLFYGIGTQEHSLNQVAAELGVTKKTAEQILAQALRKLRHPKLSRQFAALDRTFVFTPLAHPEEKPAVITVPPSKPEPPRSREEILNTSVDELEVSTRVANALGSCQIRWIWELVERTEKQMLTEVKNFGKSGLKETKEILAEMGLTYGMQFDDEMKAKLYRYTELHKERR